MVLVVLLQEEPGPWRWDGHRVTGVEEQGWGSRGGIPLPTFVGQRQPQQPLCSSNPHSGLELCAL